MSDATAAAGPALPAAAAATSAGRLLREAREKQGLHIAALAASIKVTPKKLEALESDRFDALPDATFTRALAQTVCRALKIDAAPVMRLLPPPAGHRLEQVGEGLNAPFRNRSGALVQRDGSGLASSPALWLTALILAAAVAVFFLPSGFSGRIAGNAAPATRASGDDAANPPPLFVPAPTSTLPPATAQPASAAATATPEAQPLPATAAPSAALSAMTAPAAGDVTAAPTEAAPAGLLQVQVSAASWVEVADARGQPVLARLLRAGESVGVDGTPPLRVRIGNASATRLTHRGQPIELAAFTRDNVARLELK